QHLDERELVFRVVDLSPEERRAGAVLLRFGEELERIVRRAGGSAQNTGHERRIVRREFLHELRTVVDNLQEDGTACARHAGEGSRNLVVDEMTKLIR